RDQLLRRFRDAGSAILLGTDSFWEGVDVPGRALRVLILAKLPFKVPSEPLTAARLERLTEAGVDGFSHYLVPLAALKLKQGFGLPDSRRGGEGPHTCGARSRHEPLRVSARPGSVSRSRRGLHAAAVRRERRSVQGVASVTGFQGRHRAPRDRRAQPRRFGPR